MLDLQKYLAMAEADPGFRARLFENANQAIKDEFGEDLPYKLKCREKLVFEVEPMEGLLSDDSWENVAGGIDDADPEPGIINTNVGTYMINALTGAAKVPIIVCKLPYDLGIGVLDAVNRGLNSAEKSLRKGAEGRLLRFQNRARHLTDGMGLNSTGK